MSTFDPEYKKSDNHINIKFDNNVNPSLFYNDNNIVVLDNVLNDREIEYIINFINNNIINNNNNKRTKLYINCNDLSNIIKERCKKNIPSSVYKYSELLDNNNHYNNQMYWVNPTINPSWRFVKCNPGSSLTKHYDGVYVRSVDNKSIYTLLIYLNDTDGDTWFKNITVSPKKGRLVLFDQSLLHEGLVNNNVKYIIRSEIMYERLDKIETYKEKEAMRIYNEAYLNNSEELEEKAFAMSPLLESLIINL